MHYIRRMKSSKFESTSHRGRFIRPDPSNKTTIRQYQINREARGGQLPRDGRPLGSGNLSGIAFAYKIRRETEVALLVRLFSR